jgi:hypothetical protein
MSKFDSLLSDLKAQYNAALEASSAVAVPSEDFEEFKKIPRLNRDIVITEKIDGTNAQILIEALAEDHHLSGGERIGDALCVVDRTGKFFRFRAGSRSRWITPERDNANFAKWAFANAQALVALFGEGRHYGEWWGSGVQRSYGLKEKRFSLFNVSRYGQQEYFQDPRCVVQGRDGGPVVEHKHHNGVKVCQCRDARSAITMCIGGVLIEPVPILYRGPWFDTSGMWAPELCLEELKQYGSRAVDGYHDPEGIVVFHEASGVLFKATCKNDEKPKGQV